MNLTWSRQTSPTAAQIRKTLPADAPDVAEQLTDLLHAARPYSDPYAPEGVTPAPVSYYGRAGRQGRLWAIVSEDVIGRRRPPGPGPLHDLANHAPGA